MKPKTFLLCVLAAVCVVDAHSASAEVEKRLEFNSPDNRWQVVAQWDSKHLGYLYELHDLSTGSVYFKQTTVADNEGLPYRFRAIWSPGGRYVAINLYYGRIAQDVIIIDVSGKKPSERLLLTTEQLDTAQFPTGASAWLNETDLAVQAHSPLFRPHQPDGITSYDLVVRVDGPKSTIIKKVGYR